MRIKIDKETDTLYFRFDENKVVESDEVQPGVIFDFDSKNQVVGLEMLNLSQRTEQKNLSTMHVEFETV